MNVKTTRGIAEFVCNSTIDDIDRKAREFGDAVVDGYREREAELRAAIADAEDAVRGR